MRTITREYNLYPITELSNKAFETAYNKWLYSKEYQYSSDNRKTMEEFQTLFDVVVKDWRYDAYTYSYRFHTNVSQEIEELKGIRLLKYIINNQGFKLFAPKTFWSSKNYKKRTSKIFVSTECNLTGYCADYEILEPIYSFLKNPDKDTSFLQLMDKCLDNFFKYCKNDVESTESEEYFKEESLDRNYEYLENGTLFN